MKPEHTADLIRLRMKQAHDAVDDAQFLLDGNRTPQSIVHRDGSLSY